MSLCPTCQSPFCPNSDIFAPYQPDVAVVDGLTIMSFDLGADISPADLGLDIDLDAIIAEALYDQFRDQVEGALAEVEIGNSLTNDEGDVLATYIRVLEQVSDELDADAEDYREQLIAEEGAHSETLADLYEAQDRIAELEAQVAGQKELLLLASKGLSLAARTIEDAARERAFISIFYGV